MSILKVKSILFSLIAVLMVAVFMTSCEQGELVSPNGELPDIVEQQLMTSQDIWNKSFSEQLTYVSHEYVSDIKNEFDKENVLVSIADEANLVASGNIQEPQTIKVQVLEDTAEETLETRRNIRHYMAEGIEIGNQVIAITWKRGDETYITHCIANENGIVWDNVLGGVISVDPKGEEIYFADTKTSSYPYGYRWRAYWLWGSKRGEMGYRITIYYNGSYVHNTDRYDYAYISIGSAASESKILKNSGSYGKIQYGLGLTTPTGSLSINHDNVSVSASGIGSNMVRNGTKSLYPR